MLALDTEVDRRLALCFLVPLLLSALIVIYISYGAATLEFKYAVWFRKTSYMPAITELYREVYRWGWAIPCGLGLWAIFLVRKTSCRLVGIILWAGIECVLLTFWVAFTVLAFYLGNQSFFASNH